MKVDLWAKVLGMWHGMPKRLRASAIAHRSDRLLCLSQFTMGELFRFLEDDLEREHGTNGR